MIINPTVKAMPLFNALDKVTDVEAAKAYCAENPFYSWHAHYTTINRKKVLFLVNDLTLLTIVIQDVNAQNKKYLDEMIRDRIRNLLDSFGFPHKKLEKYYRHMDDIQIYKGHSRSITTIINKNIMYTEDLEYDEYYWAEAMDICNNIIVSTIGYNNPIEKTIEVFETY